MYVCIGGNCLEIFPFDSLILTPTIQNIFHSQHSLYTQGLENQARISANQTAGVGKLGEFTREQMNAIQYGAEAGALNQRAQGNSLRRVFGTGAGFQESYSAMANTQADMQNYTARETTKHKCDF